MKCNNTNTLKDKIREQLHDFGIVKDFLNKLLKTLTIKRKD